MSHHAIAPGALLSLAIGTLLAGCAGVPQPSLSAPRLAPTAARPAPAAIFGCNDLRAEIAAAESAQRTAVENGDDAWKAVVPIAVIARYAKGRKEAADASERLAQLEADADRKGCARHGD